MDIEPFDIAEQNMESVTETLKLLGSPAKLSESPWISSCLVTERCRTSPGLIAEKALQDIFEGVLDQVRELQPNGALYADILKEVFWDREHGVTHLARYADDRLGVSRSAYFDHYREAREEFTALLLQRETACRQLLWQASNNQADLVEDSTATTERLVVVDSPAPQSGYWGRITERMRHPTPLTLSALGIVLIFLAAIGRVLLAPSDDLAEAPDSPEPLITITPAAPTATAIPTKAPLSVTLCGEQSQVNTPSEPEFLRAEGIHSYSPRTMRAVVKDDYVRIVSADESGVWYGYHALSAGIPDSLGHYDGEKWFHCVNWGSDIGKNVNDVLTDDEGRLWVATERSGVAMFDGNEWKKYEVADGLPSNGVYGLALDEEGNVWASTWFGVARFDGESWQALDADYLFINHAAHEIAFLDGDIWIGHVLNGVSQFDSDLGKWIHLTAVESGLGGDAVRRVMVRQAMDGTPASVWIATADAGISKYEDGQWTVYQVEDGLPSNDVSDLAIDRYGRAWAATMEGVVYFEDGVWKPYTTVRTHSIAFSPDCEECPFGNSDFVWLGTGESGLAKGRLPFPDNAHAVEIQRICFRDPETDARICPQLDIDEDANILTATYPAPLSPGDRLQFEVVTLPHSPVVMIPGQGDMLLAVDDSDQNLYGAYPHIEVNKTVEAGKVYTFTDSINPLVVPEPDSDLTEELFTSQWQLWLNGRYVGPRIDLQFVSASPDNP